jgi:hypothetical protein
MARICFVAAMFLATTVNVAWGGFVSTSYSNRSWVEVIFEREQIIRGTGERIDERTFSYRVPLNVTSMTVTADELTAQIIDIQFDIPTIIPAHTAGDSYPGGYSDFLEVQSITVPTFAFSRSSPGQYYGSGADRYAYVATGIIVPPLTVTGVYHMSGPSTTKSKPFSLEVKTTGQSSILNEQWSAQGVFINNNTPLTNDFTFGAYGVAANYGVETVFFDDVDGALTLAVFRGVRGAVNFFVPEPGSIGGAMAGLVLICSAGRRRARTGLT